MRAAIILWLMSVGAVLAAPAETPPRDFTGAQYIDSAGCVFLRDGTAWMPRLDDGGAVICGYPPTPTSRSVNEDEAGEIASSSPEKALAQTLAHGLRDGELTTDPRPREERRPAPPAKTPASSPVGDLPAMVVAAPALRREMGADLNPNRRLCELLGYKADGTAAAGLGGDATQGFCGGATDDQPLRRVVAAPVAAEPAQDAQPAARQAAAHSETPKVRRTASRKASPAPPTPAVRATKTSGPRTILPSQQPGAEMIPAGARFVYLGAFGDHQSWSAVIRQLQGLGYPVARERGQTKTGSGLYAGPFSDRRSLVAALNDLRARSIGRPVAR